MCSNIPDTSPSPPVTIDSGTVVEASLADKASQLIVRAKLFGLQLMIVCDGNTHAALGKRLLHELAELKPALFMLEGKPHPDESTVSLIRSQKYDALIAVGSGTISDLCKYASFLDKLPS